MTLFGGLYSRIYIHNIKCYVHGVKLFLSNILMYFNSCALGLGEGVKEKLVPLIQGPSDTTELHMSRWLNEIRKPESLLAPDLLAFSVQVPQQGDDCRNSGTKLEFHLKYWWSTAKILICLGCWSHAMPPFSYLLSLEDKCFSFERRLATLCLFTNSKFSNSSSSLSVPCWAD